MYNRKEFHLQGYNNQGNLALFLAKREDELTMSRFYQELLELQKSDPLSYSVAGVTVAGEKVALLISRHATFRASYRLSAMSHFLEQRCAEILKNSVVGAEILLHTLYLNEEGNQTVSCDGIVSTNVVDMLSNTIFSFQAGFQYIRLATVWNLEDGVFFAKPNTSVLKLNRDGFVITDPELIPEVRITEDTRPNRATRSHV